MQLFTRAVIALLALATATYAQTWTDCNPMNGNCPPDTALGTSNYSINFQTSTMTSTVWNTTAGGIRYGNNGAEFVVSGKLDSPTVKTNFYIFFGTVEVVMQSAHGQGIVSSIVMQSDDLDEIDWEWIGGNNSYVQTNYFGKGNTTSFDRAVWHPVDDPQGGFHNYTTDWSAEKIDWYVDGQIIRTLKYEDANGGHNFPQTPCDVRLGIWPGGDPKNPNGTIEWAGGLVDYSKGPFTMTVASVRISDASTGTQYVYGDTSGNMNSIKALNTTAPIKLDGNNGTMSQTVKQKWNSLSTGTKIAILASVLGSLAIGLIVFAICCIKQRRLGKHEKLLEDAKFEKDRTELMAYRAEMGRMRSEKLAYVQQTRAVPQNMGYPSPHIMPSSNSIHSGYAPSMRSAGYAHSAATGRGYQRF